MTDVEFTVLARGVPYWVKVRLDITPERGVPQPTLAGPKVRETCKVSVTSIVCEGGILSENAAQLWLHQHGGTMLRRLDEVRLAKCKPN